MLFAVVVLRVVGLGLVGCTKAEMDSKLPVAHRTVI
jgi:hypothetical protein